MIGETSETKRPGLRPDRVWQGLLRGGAWLFAMRLTQRLLGMARMVLLARLLAPSDFGLMSIALVMIALVRQFSESGFKAALVQRQGDIQEHLSTAWTVEVLRGLMMAGIVLAAAPLLGMFFDAPAAVPVLRVLAIALFLDGAKNIGMVHLQRDMTFNRYFVFNLVITLTDIVVSLALALMLRNVWALVYGYLASAAIGFLLSFVIAPCPWRLGINGRALRDLFRFGKWMTASNMLAYFLSQLDKIVIGRVLGVASLGLYQMAYNISNLTAEEIYQVANRVAFPAYARVQAHTDLAKQTLLKLVQIVSLVSLPSAVGLIVIAHRFTLHILGEQWMAMVGAMQLLGLLSILRSSAQPAVQLLKGLDRPDVPAKSQLINLSVLGVLIVPFTRWWGLEGAVGALLAGSAVSQPLIWLHACRLVRASALEVVGAMAPALAGAGAVLAGVWLVGQAGSALVVLAIQIAAGVAIYLTALALWAAVFKWNPKHLLT